MAMRNPSTLLYTNINKSINNEQPIKKNNNGLLTRGNSRVNTMSKQNIETKPIISVVNHLRQIRQLRESLNDRE
tara:strand:+ start:187 stop:408 length:222 start_codon:yes stop_codon:yes gene_type:complete